MHGMSRTYLSNSLTVPMKVITALMILPVLFLMVPELMSGQLQTLPIALLIFFFAARSWIQDVVYIEGRELVVDRMFRSVRVRPDDIEDLRYFGPTQLMRIIFRKKTIFGKSVVFGPRYESLFDASNNFRDEGEIFEKVGRFCGWKSAN